MAVSNADRIKALSEVALETNSSAATATDRERESGYGWNVTTKNGAIGGIKPAGGNGLFNVYESPYKNDKVLFSCNASLGTSSEACVIMKVGDTNLYGETFQYEPYKFVSKDKNGYIRFLYDEALNVEYEYRNPSPLPTASSYLIYDLNGNPIKTVSQWFKIIKWNVTNGDYNNALSLYNAYCKLRSGIFNVSENSLFGPCSYYKKYFKNNLIPIYAWHIKRNGDNDNDSNKLWVAVNFILKSSINSTFEKHVKGWIRIHETDPNSSTHNRQFLVYTGTTSISKDTYDNSNNDLMPSSSNLLSDDDAKPEPTANDEWEINEDYQAYLDSENSKEMFSIWQELYSGKDASMYSLKSHQAIIGLPLQFMPNVDMRVGSSTYGKQYMEDILYDMNIAIIKPGGPVLNPAWDSTEEYSTDLVTNTLRKYGKLKAYWDTIKESSDAGDTIQKMIFALMKNSKSRFYSFMSDWTHYLHYVNTLCHMFAIFLGIEDTEYRTGDGQTKKYIDYNDDIREMESDNGNGLRTQFGTENAVYMYYSDAGSSLNQSFSNTTMKSSLDDTLQGASDAVKEAGFFMNAAGIETGRNVASLADAFNQATSFGGSTPIGRMFKNLGEGVTTVITGNNMSLPEIYQDSDTTVQHEFTVKLVSPYGDPESIFLYVLRPLARIMAFSLPRQYGPNSYTSPFIVQAFSKGQFNCQLGIVESLSIRRCGQGGESHTINHIPTELEVTITIGDMYDKVFISNEYFNSSKGAMLFAGLVDHITGSNAGEGTTSKIFGYLGANTAASLMFNNVGLIDFMASFCGYNLNLPTYMNMWELISHIIKNRSQEIFTWNQNDSWAFPYWEKELNDAYNDACTNLKTFISTVN